MKGPQKLIEGDSQASPFARELLREGRIEVMPAQAKAALWKSIAAQASGALAVPAGAAAAGAAKGVTGLVALKGALAVVALGGAIWGGHYVVSSGGGRTKTDVAPVPAPASAAGVGPVVGPVVGAVASSAPAEVPAVTAPAGVPRKAPEAPLAPRATRPSALLPRSAAALAREPARPPRPARAEQDHASPSVAPPSSRLREESQLVLEARDGLRAGRAFLVLRQLEAARARFPDGALAQEREALTIEALCRSGQTVAARRRADAFVRTYPGSPHVAHVQQLTSR
jgi:outer membrane lipoprotein YfiO